MITLIAHNATFLPYLALIVNTALRYTSDVEYGIHSHAQALNAYPLILQAIATFKSIDMYCARS